MIALIEDMIAVSESTKGPIMVNLATYVGNAQAGLFGKSKKYTSITVKK